MPPSASVKPDPLAPRAGSPAALGEGLPVPRRYWSIQAIWLAIGMAVGVSLLRLRLTRA